MIGLLMMLAIPAHGYVATSAKTEMLAEICVKPSGKALTADFCTGYIMATFDSLAIAGKVCGNENTSTVQIVAVGRKYLADHPESWDKQPAWVLGEIFRKTFPCG